MAGTAWEEVESTYTEMVGGMRKYFTVDGKEKIGVIFHEPRMTSMYAAHRLALEELFRVVSRNPRNHRYYLGIKQLEEHGHRTDEKGREIPGIPMLPPLERIFSSES